MTHSNTTCIRTGSKIVTVVSGSEQEPTVANYSSISRAKQAMRAAMKAGNNVEVVASKQQNPAKQPAPSYVCNGKKFPKKQQPQQEVRQQVAKQLMNTVVNYR